MNLSLQLITSSMEKLRVRDLMTTQVVTLKPTDTIKKATITFAVDNVTGAPVVDNRNHIIGIITDNDILSLIVKYQETIAGDVKPHNLLDFSLDGENSDDVVADVNKKISSTKVEDIMTRSVLTTTPDENVIEALKVMLKMDIKAVPVLEKGILIGILSRSDIIFYIYKRKI